MPAPVSIARCASYSQEEVAEALAAALEPLGGMRAFVSAGQRVFLKPNLLMKAVPERAVTTHPSLVRAVIREVKACGAAEVLVGDSPGGRNTLGSIAKVWEAAGLADVCRDEGARLVLPDDDVVRVPNPDSSLYASFNLGREMVEADVLIDLPKLKTHGFQQFTGAVKNLFGCVPGLEKAQFHLKVPDRYDFGRMLVDLMLACKPALAIMDGIVGMEGEGPGGGDPVELGLLLASADLVAMDVVASSIVGFDPMDVYTNRAAYDRGLGPKTADEVEVAGVQWRDVRPASFAKPVRDIVGGLPVGLARRLRKATTMRPSLARPNECTGCATCRQTCPVGAIRMREGRPHFDYDLCIRCYCCQELCPPQAIGGVRPFLLRVLSRETGGER
jgi:uncharacterized protein (DUF362 family)/ferredoxin